MKVVYQIFAKIFIYFFLFIIILEISTTIFIAFYHSSVLTDAIEKVKENSFQKIQNLNLQISYTLIENINRLTEEMIYIGKHLLLLDYSNEDSPKINKESEYYKSYKNCIINVNTTDFLLNEYFNEYMNEDGTMGIKQKLLKDYEEESEIIDILLDLKVMNFIGFSGNDSNLNEENETKICYLISLFKSLFIRDFIVERENSQHLRWFLYADSDYFIYPVQLPNESFLYSLFDCNENNFPSCLNSLKNIDEILFMNFYPYLKNIGMSVCLKVPYDNNSIVCSEFEFQVYLKQYSFESEDEISNFLIYQQFLEENSDEKYFVFHYSRNDFNTNDYFKNTSFNINDYRRMKFFNILYYDIYSKEKFRNIIDTKKIEKEYISIRNTINEKIESLNENFYNDFENNTISFLVKKTYCKKKLFNLKVNCDAEALMQITISPIYIKKVNITKNYFGENLNQRDIIFYTVSMTRISDKDWYNLSRKIMGNKIFKVTCYFIVFSCFIIFSSFMICRIILEHILSTLSKIKNELKIFNEGEEITELQNFEKRHIDSIEKFQENYFKIIFTQKYEHKTKDMKILGDIFNSMKKVIALKNIIASGEEISCYKEEFLQFIQSIKEDDARNVCYLVLAYSHLRNKNYQITKRELKYLLDFLKKKENKLASELGENQYELKDIIQRYSDISYINDYTTFKKLNESIIPLIKARLLKQRILYLYAMCNYSEVKEIKDNPVYASKVKSIPNLSEKDLQEAILAFLEAKTINKNLGMNPIREIYCLIMIGKSTAYQKDYKKAISYLNEALILFMDLIKLFKEQKTKNFEPRLMLFIFNHVFQEIMMTIAQAARLAEKPNAVGWIILQIFNTSPFLIETIHNEASKLLISSLRYIEKNKKKLEIIPKLKKFYYKQVSRINFRLKVLVKEERNSIFSSMRKFSNLLSANIIGTQSLHANSNQSNVRNVKKEITICVSEKTIEKECGNELKDVIVKYLQKFFENNDRDTFSFVQFAKNGKIPIHFKPQKLSHLINKIQTNKEAFEINETTFSNTKNEFLELFKIFETVINQSNRDILDISDNIILLFISADDIRFTSREECVNIIHELNENNFSLFIFVDDREISDIKIKNIKMFISGLFEGYFIHFKNYGIIKQVLTNIATLNRQDNFFNFNYENINNII